MKFNDMGVARKLWFVILGLLLAMLLSTTWAQFNAARVMEQALRSIATYEANIASAIRWRGQTETATAMVLVGAISTDSALAKMYETRVKDIIAKTAQVQAEAARNATSVADKKAIEAIATERTLVLQLTARARETSQAGDAGATQSFVDREYQPAVDRYLAALDELVKVREQQRDAARAEAEVARRDGSLMGLGVVSLVFAIGIALTVALVRSITAPLRRALAMTDAVAGGDLTQHTDDARGDEFGNLLRSLSAMTTRLRGLVTQVRGGVESVSSASVQIASGNQDLSLRTEQAAANLEQTAASMEQLTSTVAQSADTARQANQLAATAAQAAAQGGEIVAKVVSSMQNISESSRKISDIIGTIDSIAFQTNILALNAAVEAARAGEQGRGFAVVASEVRGLASRSAQAAKEIKALIGASVQTVESGSQQVVQAGRSMGDIVSSVRRVSDLIGEISASSIEQRDGLAQVNQAVNNLDQMTQQNAALVEQSAAAAAGLREQAQRLAEVVSVFNVGAHSSALTAPPRARALAVRAPVQRAALPRPAPAFAPSKPRMVTVAPTTMTPMARRTAGTPTRLAAPVVRRPAPPAPATPLRRPAPVSAKKDDGDWESF